MEKIMEKKSNIVLFVADQMRSDSLHHLGNEASITPNFDKLLEEGISFENAYCQNPVCVPSRCSFLTGLYPHTTGHRTMHFLQREYEPNILKEMKQNGYEVIWIGRNDVIPANKLKTDYCDQYYDGIRFENTRDEPQSAFKPQGKQTKITEEMMKDDRFYSFYIGKLKDSEGYGKQDWNCLQSVIDYIERKAKEGNEKPFFLYCTLTFPHPPYACEDPWYSMIDRQALPERRPDINRLQNKASMLYGIRARQNLDTWSEQRFNELRATYLAMVARFDHQYGLLADKLKEKNLYNNTNIIIYSDHGDYTGDYSITEKAQNSFEDCIANVPLLIKPSKEYQVKAGINKALVELLDLPATIADMAKIKLSYTQFGKSLVHCIEGDQEHKDAVFCEGGRIHGEDQAKESGHGRTSMYWPRLETQQSEGSEHTKAIMCRIGNLKYTYRLYEDDELYDLDDDPMEIKNLIYTKEYQKECHMCKERILQFMVETGDFVPKGRDLR